MRIITGCEELSQKEKCAVALGKFDGIHRGHQELLSRILEQKGEGLLSCVFTFDPPPEVLFGWSEGKELTTREEKRKIFKDMGVDLLVEFPMTKESAAIPPEDFVRELLCKRLHCKYLAAGKDLSFGRGGKGNEELLREMAAECGFQVETIDKVCINDQEVSSTYIRSLVKGGRMEECEQYLGRPYSILGKVVHGNQIGTTIGVPTANLQVPGDKLMPPNGVYFSQVLLADKSICGISNIGVKPTIPGENPLGVETSLFDFHEDLYGRELEITFLHFQRPEQRFADVAALKGQIQQDIVGCKDFFSKENVKNMKSLCKK